MKRVIFKYNVVFTHEKDDANQASLKNFKNTKVNHLFIEKKLISIFYKCYHEVVINLFDTNYIDFKMMNCYRENNQQLFKNILTKNVIKSIVYSK